MDEIGVKRLACFLDKRDLTMFESLATPNKEQPAPSWDLNVGDLGVNFGIPRLMACNGYLGHPLKNMHFENDNDLPPLLANKGR